MKVAFLGLGTMGWPMARNVARAGHALTVWNRTRAKADSLAAAHPGVRVASDPEQAVRGAEVVISMLADPAALTAAFAQAQPALDRGATWIDMSTVGPATARAIAERARAREVAFVDAPVSGSRRPAHDATLAILAAGDPAVVERLRPLLEAMGRVRYVGPTGAGAALKLLLNGLGAHMIAGFSSMLLLATKLGLEPQAALEVIQSSAFSSPLYAAKGPKIVARDFQPDFSLELLHKDQQLVLAAARDCGLALPTLEAVERLIARAIAAGRGQDDLCALGDALLLPNNLD